MKIYVPYVPRGWALPFHDSQRAAYSDPWERARLRALMPDVTSKQLKDLGHSVSNITRAFDSMMSQRPRLVIQVRKSGKTKQARKRYRVSREGIKRVQSMLAEIKGADDGE